MAKTLKKVVPAPDDVGNSDGLNALVEKLGINGIGKTLIDHNRYSTLATLLAIGLLVFVKSYQPLVDDPFHHGQKETAATILAERDAKVKQLKGLIATSEKEVKDMRPRVEQAGQQAVEQEKQFGVFLSTAIGLAAPFAGPFAPVVLAVAGLVATGFAADAARKGAQVSVATGAASSEYDTAETDEENDVTSGLSKVISAIPTSTKKSAK